MNIGYIMSARGRDKEEMFESRSMCLLVLLLDTSLALGVDEATAGAGAGLATEHATLTGSAVL